MNIAFLGLGNMGRRMAGRLIQAGHAVTVWNRTPGVELPGASLATSPAAAAQQADLVISMIRDDDASRDVWLGEHGALAAMPNDATGLECSTVSLPYITELANAFRQAGRELLDAPVAGSLPQAEAGSLIFFVGGAAAALERATPALESMAGAIHHAGPNGAGALVKLMVNALFGAQLAAVGELIGLAERAGHDIERAVEVLAATPVMAPAAAVASRAMLAKRFAPAFPIDLVAKDFALVTASGAAFDASLPLAASCAAIYTAAAQEGIGDANITGIVQRYRN
ncbi:MAG: NAD(P)-dependent oxidoreductase [Planctomycetota bacterium]